MKDILKPIEHAQLLTPIVVALIRNFNAKPGPGDIAQFGEEAEAILEAILKRSGCSLPSGRRMEHSAQQRND
jgi:hypothetical protein